jgi:hypothetical protein
MPQKKETIQKASKQVIKDYYNKGTSLFPNGNIGLLPDFDREKVLEAIRKDSTVISSITTLVDKTLENGWKLEGKDKRSNLNANEEKLKKAKFNKVLRQLFYNIYAYNNVFIENVKNGNGGFKELHILETTTVEPLADEHGEVYGYKQQTAGEDVTWTTDEVTHIAVNTLTTNVWGEIDIQSIWTSVLVKQYIMQYIGWLTGTNQLRGFFNVKSAGDTQVEDFISHLKKLETDINKPLVAEGDIVYQVLGKFEEGQTLLDVLEHCDNNIRTLLQVPPISLGQPDSSNRSNSDTQEGSLFTRIKSIQDLVTDELNYDLFPKIGMEKTRIVFNPINRIAISRIIENGMKLREMSVKENVIKEYFKLEGFPIDLAFEDKQEIEGTGDNDLDPSRRRKLADDSQNKIGSGQESSTREDQLVKKGNTRVVEEYEDDSIRFVKKVVE